MAKPPDQLRVPFKGRPKVSSIKALITALGYKTPDVYHQSKNLPGAPGRTENGKYDCEAWRRFILSIKDTKSFSDAGSELSETESLKREREQISLELASNALERERGTYAPIELLTLCLANVMAYVAQKVRNVRRLTDEEKASILAELDYDPQTLIDEAVSKYDSSNKSNPVRKSLRGRRRGTGKTSAS